MPVSAQPPTAVSTGLRIPNTCKRDLSKLYPGYIIAQAVRSLFMAPLWQTPTAPRANSSAPITDNFPVCITSCVCVPCGIATSTTLDALYITRLSHAVWSEQQGTHSPPPRTAASGTNQRVLTTDYFIQQSFVVLACASLEKLPLGVYSRSE